MSSIPADYTSLPVAAEKVWTAWFGQDLERQPPPSQAMVSARLSPLENGPVLQDSAAKEYAKFKPPSWVPSRGSRVTPQDYRLSLLSKWRVAWSRLFHALFSSPLPVFYVQTDGSLSSLPPLIGGLP